MTYLIIYYPHLKYFYFGLSTPTKMDHVMHTTDCCKASNTSPNTVFPGRRALTTLILLILALSCAQATASTSIRLPVADRAAKLNLAPMDSNNPQQMNNSTNHGSASEEALGLGQPDGTERRWFGTVGFDF